MGTVDGIVPRSTSTDAGAAGTQVRSAPLDGPGAPAALVAVTLVGVLGIRVAGVRRRQRRDAVADPAEAA